MFKHHYVTRDHNPKAKLDVYGSMIRRFQAQMDSGKEVPNCMVKKLIESQQDENLDWKDLCMLSAFFMLGEVHSASVLPLETVKVSHHFSVDIWHHPALMPSMWQKRLMRSWIEL